MKKSYISKPKNKRLKIYLTKDDILCHSIIYTIGVNEVLLLQSLHGHDLIGRLEEN